MGSNTESGDKIDCYQWLSHRHRDNKTPHILKEDFFAQIFFTEKVRKSQWHNFATNLQNPWKYS